MTAPGAASADAGQHTTPTRCLDRLRAAAPLVLSARRLVAAAVATALSISIPHPSILHRDLYACHQMRDIVTAAQPPQKSMGRDWVSGERHLPRVLRSNVALRQVLGNVKGVVAVVVSVLWFRNPISLYGMLGYGVTVCGVIAYSQVTIVLSELSAVRFGTRQGTAL